MTSYQVLSDQLTVISLQEDSIEDFAEARNKALKNVKTEWAFFVDNDEAVSSELKSEVFRAINTTMYDGYTMKRTTYFMGKPLRHGEVNNYRLLRLARVNKGEWKRPVHEVWEIDGRVGELKNSLLHHPKMTISKFLGKVDHYSELDAGYRFKNKVHSSLLRILLNPIGKFIRSYIILAGFLDGVPGLIMSTMMSFHSFLTWTKLYLLWRKN